MKPSSRALFKQFILENLGAPVIKVNVSDNQVENRIDQALYTWQEYHPDATERVFVPIRVTATDKANKYVAVPEEVIGVYKVVHLGDIRGLVNNVLSTQHLMRLQLIDMFNMFDRSVIPYFMAMTHISMLDQLLSPQPLVEFNRHVDRLYLQMNWDRLGEDEYLVIDGRKVISSNQMWEDRWLQDYAEALVRFQWGSNLSKYTGAQTPGGIAVNGPTIKAEAKADIASLEETLKRQLAEPLGIFLG